LFYDDIVHENSVKSRKIRWLRRSRSSILIPIESQSTTSY